MHQQNGQLNILLEFEAVYENGVFRPLEHVQLAEHEHVHVLVAENRHDETETKNIRRQQEGIRAMLEETARLPVRGPKDGFSGRDHDKILYEKGR